MYKLPDFENFLISFTIIKEVCNCTNVNTVQRKILEMKKVGGPGK